MEPDDLAGSVVTLEARTFDVVELLDTCQRDQVKSMSIVGDAFARPILRALDAEPDRWDISALRVIVSSGVMWSAETKAGLLRHNPRLIMIDSLGSSEAIGMANATTTADGTAPTARFRLGPNTRVLTEDGRDVVPGSGERGTGGAPGPHAGRATTRTRRSRRPPSPSSMACATRYPVTGPRWPRTAPSSCSAGAARCINTGGEKVHPEEVEEVLKQHPAIADAAVVGVPDERFGEAIAALVEVLPGQQVDAAEVIAHVKTHLASYKAPKRVLQVASVGRAANGKLDYRSLKAQAEADAGSTAGG